MFSKSKPSQNAESEGHPVFERSNNTTTAPTGRSTFSVLGDDVMVTGNIKASVDLHVDGGVEGDVNCASLIQGHGSIIKGNVIADVARISGTVEGSITARELIIEHSAQVKGDVSYESISIAQGGQVDGKFAYKAAGALSRTNPDLQLLTHPVEEEEAA